MTSIVVFICLLFMAVSLSVLYVSYKKVGCILGKMNEASEPKPNKKPSSISCYDATFRDGKSMHEWSRERQKARRKAVIEDQWFLL